MTFQIREMRKDDLSAVMRMLKDFAAFEKLSEYCTTTEQRLHDALFGRDRVAEGLILESETEIGGYAIFYPSFSSFRGERGFYLEDIYVKPGFQRYGAGRAILSRIARIGALRGYERIDFQVLDWNTPAIDFYKRFGAESNEGETHFKFSGKAFTDLASVGT